MICWVKACLDYLHWHGNILLRRISMVAKVRKLKPSGEQPSTLMDEVQTKVATQSRYVALFNSSFPIAEVFKVIKAVQDKKGYYALKDTADFMIKPCARNTFGHPITYKYYGDDEKHPMHHVKFKRKKPIEMSGYDILKCVIRDDILVNDGGDIADFINDEYYDIVIKTRLADEKRHKKYISKTFAVASMLSEDKVNNIRNLHIRKFAKSKILHDKVTSQMYINAPGAPNPKTIAELDADYANMKMFMRTTSTNNKDQLLKWAFTTEIEFSKVFLEYKDDTCSFKDLRVGASTDPDDNEHELFSGYTVALESSVKTYLALNKKEYLGIKDVPEELRLFIRYIVNGICAEKRDVANVVLDWLGMFLYKPGYSHNNALCLQGGGGSGKSLLYYLIASLIHKVHSMVIATQGQLNDNFSAINIKMIMLRLIDDFDGFKAEQKQMLKTAITNSEMPIRHMRQSGDSMINIMNNILTANPENAYESLNENDADNRRFVILKVKSMWPANGDEFKELGLFVTQRLSDSELSPAQLEKGEHLRELLLGFLVERGRAAFGSKTRLLAVKDLAYNTTGGITDKINVIHRHLNTAKASDAAILLVSYALATGKVFKGSRYKLPPKVFVDRLLDASENCRDDKIVRARETLSLLDLKNTHGGITKKLASALAITKFTNNTNRRIIYDIEASADAKKGMAERIYRSRHTSELFNALGERYETI